MSRCVYPKGAAALRPCDMPPVLCAWARPRRRHRHRKASENLCGPYAQSRVRRMPEELTRRGGPQALPIHLRFVGVGVCTYALCSCRTCPPRPSPRLRRCPRRQPPVSCVRSLSKDTCRMRWAAADSGALPMQPGCRMCSMSYSPRRPRVLAAVRHGARRWDEENAHAPRYPAPRRWRQDEGHGCKLRRRRRRHRHSARTSSSPTSPSTPGDCAWRVQGGRRPWSTAIHILCGFRRPLYPNPAYVA
ncbi:hypothetical protein C8R46DRAFT_308432 [Mycena filopes]|nr:hypothetical protein C8R46DRAFT_308432 [Mycena filopes]